MNQTETLMSNRSSKLYLIRLVSGFGDWLTFLAIALLLKDRFGTDKIAFAFLITGIAPILFASRMAALVPKRDKERAVISLLVLSAANVASLVLDLGLWHVYLYLFFASLLSTASRSIFNTLIGEWISAEERPAVQTRLGAITTSLLALTPPLGGVISKKFGFETLFYIDAFTFLLAACIVSFLRKEARKENLQPSHQSDLRQVKPSRAAIFERDFPKPLLAAVVSWYLVLILGATLNALEFPAFEAFRYGETQIGFILGAWGVGGLVALVFAKPMTRYIPMPVMMMAFVTSVVLFLVGNSTIVSLCTFFLGALSSSLLGGYHRAAIQASLPSNLESLTVWTLLEKRLALINIFGYGVFGLLLSRVAFGELASITSIICIIASSSWLFWHLRVSARTALPI
jgi:hypothetical protein